MQWSVTGRHDRPKTDTVEMGHAEFPLDATGLVGFEGAVCSDVENMVPVEYVILSLKG